jgi:hypothetical protein
VIGRDGGKDNWGALYNMIQRKQQWNPPIKEKT